VDLLSRWDVGCDANTYWQPAPNWKNLGFRKPPICNHFHRVTHWDRVTWFRDSWANSRLLGPQRARPRHAISVVTTYTKSRKSLYIRNEQGPPAFTDGPCLNRDGLCNPTKWRRRAGTRNCKNPCFSRVFQRGPFLIGHRFGHSTERDFLVCCAGDLPFPLATSLPRSRCWLKHNARAD
jgi:hypothetical protein